MPVYRLSHDDYLKIRNDNVYGFLADSAKGDHGDHMTLTLSKNSMPMLAARHGIVIEFHHAVHHHNLDEFR